MADLTGGGGKQASTLSMDAINDISRKLSELNERTRLLEERQKQSREKLQVVDETFTNKIKEIKGNLSSVEDELNVMRKSVDETREIVRRIAKDIESTAKLNDVRVLEKYINMVDFTRIVTKDDVIRIVQDEIRKAHLTGGKEKR